MENFASEQISRESLSGSWASVTGLHVAGVTFVCSYCSAWWLFDLSLTGEIS